MVSEAQRRASAKYRAKNLDKCRQLSRVANKRRYDTDEKYRQYCIQQSSHRQQTGTGRMIRNLFVADPEGFNTPKAPEIL